MPETVCVKMSLKEGKIAAREKKKRGGRFGGEGGGRREWGKRNDILVMKDVTKKKYIFAWQK